MVGAAVEGETAKEAMADSSAELAVAAEGSGRQAQMEVGPAVRLGGGGRGRRWRERWVTRRGGWRLGWRWVLRRRHGGRVLG